MVPISSEQIEFMQRLYDQYKNDKTEEIDEDDSSSAGSQ